MRHLYLRDYNKPNKHPVGCLAIETDVTNNEICYAFSVCSPKDKFSSQIARKKATGRLASAPVKLACPVPNSTHEITRCVMNHIIATNSEQDKNKSRSVLALEAARGWLENANRVTAESNK